MELIFSETQLDNDSFCPYMDVTFKFRLALDPEMFLSLEVIGKESMESLMAYQFREMLAEKLPERIPHIKNGMDKYMKERNG